MQYLQATITAANTTTITTTTAVTTATTTTTTLPTATTTTAFNGSAAKVKGIKVRISGNVERELK